jgi:hypothetical protein
MVTSGSVVKIVMMGVAVGDAFGAAGAQPSANAAVNTRHIANRNIFFNGELLF